MMRRISFISILLNALILCLSFGCGRDTGYLYEKVPVRHDDPLQDPDNLDLSNASYKKITWLFNCPDEPATIPVPTRSYGEFVFTTPGPHKLTWERMKGVPIKLMGQLCKPTQLPRDVALIFDVSGSMLTNDPHQNQTCGRLSAFEAVADLVDWNSTHMGFATFDDMIVSTSQRLLSDKGALIDSLTAGGTKSLDTVLCLQQGLTDYEKAFTEAERLLQQGRAGASKEIFFVTDGSATSGNDDRVIRRLQNEGIVISGRKHPVTIATIMLGSYGGDALRDRYASRDPQGNPMHVDVKDAKLLAEALANMAGGNRIVAGAMNHGSLSHPSKIDIMPYLKNNIFELPEFTIDVSQYEDAYEFQLEYWDNVQTRQTAIGKLYWY